MITQEEIGYTKEEISAMMKTIAQLRKEKEETQEKLTKLRQLADAMYEAAQNLTTDASRLHKAMQDYRQFVIYELKVLAKEEE